MIKDNLFYWEISLKNPEPVFDKYYVFDEIIVNEKLIQEVRRLRELITSYCIAKESKKESISEFLDEILDKINSIIDSVENIQYTEFIAYWKTLDMTESVFKNLNEKNKKKEVLKEIVEYYCERRRKLYDSLGYSDVTIQALYDSGASRKKGEAAIKKIVEMHKNFFEESIHVEKIDQLDSNKVCHMLPDNGDENLFEEFLKKYNLKFAYGDKAQNKKPDFLLKVENQFFIIEAKHLKEGGGTQNKSVKELIDFIKEKEDFDNIHYVGFMDGVYFNYFISSPHGRKKQRCDDENALKNNKFEKQRCDIENALKNNKSNFVLNTKGLEFLFKDLSPKKD